MAVDIKYYSYLIFYSFYNSKIISNLIPYNINMEDNSRVIKAQAVESKSFPFSNIEIYKKEQLGTGSFGVVCKARCDKLLCAAKLLHNIFILSSDPDVAIIRNKFEEECAIMATIIHPCIVQFIGVAVTMDGEPVLLTELMDTSLTKFIAEQAHTSSIRVHEEIDIVNDIAMGLSYLHSRNIVHRDLSSNNVLLNRGCKAKITDFGVSKIYDATAGSRIGSGIKYQTKCPGTPYFMSPEASRDGALYTDKLDIFSFGVICIHLLSKRYPSPGPDKVERIDSNGQIAFYPVSERNRRASDIGLIPREHCLMDLSISMTADLSSARPTANDVCDKLMKIRCSNVYKLSSARESSSAHSINDWEKLSQELKQVKLENWRLSKDLENMKTELTDRDDEVVKLKEENVKLNNEVQELKSQNVLITERLASIESTPSRQGSVEDSLTMSSTRSTGSEWTSLQPSLPCCFKRGSIARVDEKVFVSRPFSAIVHELDLEQKTWKTLPSYMNEEFSLVEFDGHLVAVGGIRTSSKKYSKMLSRYNTVNSCWESQVYPNLFNARAQPGCISTDTHLIVVGGSEEFPPKKPVNTVEIYDKKTSQWYCAYSLPQGLCNPVLVIVQDELYVIGGSSSEQPVWSMYHCPLKYLIKWSSQYMVPRSTVQQWKQVQLPVAIPTAVVLNNTLVLFGGTMGNTEGDTLNYSNQVLRFDKQRGNFAISLMPRKREKCLAVTLSSPNTVLLMGGCGSKTIDMGLFI